MRNWHLVLKGSNGGRQGEAERDEILLWQGSAYVKREGGSVNITAGSVAEQTDFSMNARAWTVVQMAVTKSKNKRYKLFVRKPHLINYFIFHCRYSSKKFFIRLRPFLS